MANKYNREGYADPTACEALRRIEREEKAARYRPLVYICSPFSGKVKKSKKILSFCTGTAYDSVCSAPAFSAVHGRQQSGRASACDVHEHDYARTLRGTLGVR